MEEMDAERFQKRPKLPTSAVELSESTFAWDIVEAVKGGRKKGERKENGKRTRKGNRKSSRPENGGEQEMLPMKELEHKQNGVVVAPGSQFVDVLLDVTLTIPKVSMKRKIKCLIINENDN